MSAHAAAAAAAAGAARRARVVGLGVRVKGGGGGGGGARHGPPAHLLHPPAPPSHPACSARSSDSSGAWPRSATPLWFAQTSWQPSCRTRSASCLPRSRRARGLAGVVPGRCGWVGGWSQGGVGGWVGGRVGGRVGERGARACRHATSFDLPPLQEREAMKQRAATLQRQCQELQEVMRCKLCHQASGLWGGWVCVGVWVAARMRGRAGGGVACKPLRPRTPLPPPLPCRPPTAPAPDWCCRPRATASCCPASTFCTATCASRRGAEARPRPPAPPALPG